jgi:hypothetical protein
MKSEERLRKEGWTRQNTIDEPRLSELVEMYGEMGLEVHLEPFHPDEMDECDDCMRKMPERYKTIYTRPKKEKGKGELDDLY